MYEVMSTRSVKEWRLSWSQSYPGHDVWSSIEGEAQGELCKLLMWCWFGARFAVIRQRLKRGCGDQSRSRLRTAKNSQGRDHIFNPRDAHAVVLQVACDNEASCSGFLKAFGGTTEVAQRDFRPGAALSRALGKFAQLCARPAVESRLLASRCAVL